MNHLDEKKTPYIGWRLFLHGCESPSLPVPCSKSIASFQSPPPPHPHCTLPHYPSSCNTVLLCTQMTLTSPSILLFRCFGPVSKQPKQTQLMVWGMKKVDILTICCCFGWSCVWFGCFETPKLPVSILKRNKQNKRLVSDSAETSFGSSFGCFDTKIVSEGTLAMLYVHSV
jgi:hypothetical protein